MMNTESNPQTFIKMKKEEIITTTEITIINPQEYGIEEKKALDLMGNLPQVKQEREILSAQYTEVLSLDIECKETAKKARELRLKVQKNRTQGINQWHKTAKDFFLKGGQFVDAIKKLECSVNESMESRLEEIEKYFEIKEANRKEALKLHRIEELTPYSDFVPFGINLGALSDEEYQKVFNGSKLQFDAKIEADRKAHEEEQKRIKIEQLLQNRSNELRPYYDFFKNRLDNISLGEISEEQYMDIKNVLINDKNEFEKEQLRIRQENERLAKEKEEAELKAQKEREEAERKLEAERKAFEEKARKEREEVERVRAEERAKQEAELKAEREKQAKLEAELKAKQEAERKAFEEKRIAEESARKEAEKLAKAPVKKQMSVWVNSFELPQLSVENEKTELIKQKFEAFKNWALKEVESL